jgi:Uma2 family endonuclease
MTLNAQPLLGPSEYLEWERRQETRHEFVNGEIFAMTGASRVHNLICLNTAAALHAQLQGRPGEIYANDYGSKSMQAGCTSIPTS